MDIAEWTFETGDRVSILQPQRGGQSVGVIPKGVLVTHVPTGLAAFCDKERSQLKNRNVAMAMIESQLNNYAY